MNLSDCACSCSQSKRKMNLSAAASASCPRMALSLSASTSRVGKRSKQFPSSSASRRVTACPSQKSPLPEADEDLEENDDVLNIIPAAAVEPWYCPLCPFVANKTTQQLTYQARWAHNRKFHPTVQAGLRVKQDLKLIRPIKDNTIALGWECPCCDHGVPLAEWQAATKSARQAMSSAHGAEHHPHITMRNWVRRLRHSQQRLNQQRSRARATGFNRQIAKEAVTPPSRRCVRFLWPWWCPRKARVAFRRAWQCSDCLRAFQNKFDFNHHRCDDPCHRQAAFRAARLAKLKKLRPIFEKVPDFSKSEADLIWANAAKAINGTALSL